MFNPSNGHSLIEASNKELTALMQDLGKARCEKQALSSRAFLTDTEFDAAVSTNSSLPDLNGTSSSRNRNFQSRPYSFRSYTDYTASRSVSSGQYADRESVKNFKGTAKRLLQRNPSLIVFARSIFVQH